MPIYLWLDQFVICLQRFAVLPTSWLVQTYYGHREQECGVFFRFRCWNQFGINSFLVGGVHGFDIDLWGILPRTPPWSMCPRHGMPNMQKDNARLWICMRLLWLEQALQWFCTVLWPSSYPTCSSPPSSASSSSSAISSSPSSFPFPLPPSSPSTCWL